MEVKNKETVREKLYQPGVKVAIRFQPNLTNGILDEKHTLYGGLSNTAVISVPAPLMVNKGEKTVAELFTREELEVLAEDLFTPEVVNPTSDFWREYAKDKNGMSVANFPINLDKSGMLLELDKPMGVIYHRILINSPIVAEDRDSVHNKETYRFYAVNYADMHKDKLKAMGNKKQAFVLYGKYESNRSVLTYVLNAMGILFDETSDDEFIQSTVFDQLEANPGRFVDIVSDKLLEAKVIIGKFVASGLVIVKNDLYYSADGNIPLAHGDNAINDLDGAAAFLKSDMGQEIYTRLTAGYKQLMKK